MAIRTKKDETDITHHVSFEQGIKKLGLVLCNGKGDPDPTAFREGKMPNRALQFSQGDPDYSDMELPYTPITQKDWSGGRGNEDFEADRSRYSDSKTIDALSGDLILAPKPTSVQLSNALDEYIIKSDQESQTVLLPAAYPSTHPTYYFYLPSGGYGYMDNLYPENVINTFAPGRTVSKQVYATGFQASFTGKIGKIKLWLARTNSISIRIFKYTPIDPANSGNEQRAMYNACCNGIENPTYNMTNLAHQMFSIAESPTLQEYEFDFIYDVVYNSTYILAVESHDQIYPIESPLADYETIFGTTNIEDAYNIMMIQTLRYTDEQPPKLQEMVFFNKWWSQYPTTGKKLAYELIPLSVAPGDAIFFTYRNTLFLVTNPADGSAPSLYMEGYHGFADNNTSHKDWILSRNVGSEAVGATVKIIAGKGSTERVRWRRITFVEEGSSGYCIVDKDWNIVHDTSTEYAIIGTGRWTEITSHGLSKAVTDVCVVNDIVYFAMGEGTNIRRMRWIGSGTPKVWTAEYANESADATFLKLIQNEEGVQKIWRALSTASTVSASDVKTWGNALAFGTAITCGNTMYRINGLVAYGTPRIPYVLKEDGFGAIANDIYDQIPLAEFEAVADDNNGRANLQRGHYLYLSLLNGIERYYEGRLDDIGANRDQGLPNDRNGYVSSLLAYPGRMYASIDHPTGFSSVLVYNDIGWHEIFRSSLASRAYSMRVQVIDGEVCDRLWVAQEGKVIWMPIAIDPKKQLDYSYNSTGELETSWISGNFREIKKYFSSIIIFSEGLSSGQYVNVSYKIDNDENNWVLINERVEQSPSQEINFPDHSVSGKRIKIKLSLYTNDSSKTPRIKGITIKPVTRLPIKNSWTMTYRVDDNQFDLLGEPTNLTSDQLQQQIKDWANSTITPLPLLMNVPHALFDGRYVFIEPESLRPIQMVYNDNLKKYVGIGQLTVFESD